MFEIILMVGASVLIGKIASTDSLSGATVWGLICAALCFASLFIPLPFLRVGIALVATFVATFVGMIVYKIVTKS